MIKIAIAGGGFMGLAHATAYKDIPGAAVVAVCEKNAETGEKFAKDFGCEAYPSLEAMLENAEFDVLDICLPTFLHEQAAALGAKHAKHVFCEKPVALGAESLERMIAAVEGAGKRFFVGQVVRFWPEYAAARELYRAGRFGDIKNVLACRVGVHPNWSEWYLKPETSGGGLFDLHLHDVDYLCSLFGRPTRVYAVGSQSPTGCWNYITSTLRFAGGNTATAQGIMGMQEGYPFTMELRLVGEKASLEYRMRAGVNLEDVGSAQRESYLYEEGRPGAPLNAGTEDAYKLELAYFIDCLQNDKEATLIANDSVRVTLATILAIQKSLETGGEVKL